MSKRMGYSRERQKQRRRERYHKAVIAVSIADHAEDIGFGRERQTVSVKYTQRNGNQGVVFFRRIVSKKRPDPPYKRYTVSRQPETVRVVHRWMPRIGGGTGQTERKPISFKYDKPTGNVKELEQEWLYRSYGEIKRFANNLIGKPAPDSLVLA